LVTQEEELALRYSIYLMRVVVDEYVDGILELGGAVVVED
jgi:hypothetical protein